jgi:hypothetical protein
MSDNDKRCTHCDKADCDTPPNHDKPMCMDCWVERTEDGKIFAGRYYAQQQYQNGVMRQMEEDYYRRHPDESSD